jgi:hypothetical protein
VIRPSARPSALALVLLGSLAASSLAACGGDGQKPPPKAGISTAEAKREYVAKKMDEARAALKEGAPRKARNAAEEARNVATERELGDVLAFIGEIDAYEAKEVAKEALQLVKGHQCADAMGTVASVVKRVPPPNPAFLTALRAATEEPIVACVRTDVDEAIAKGEFSHARSMIDNPSATASLGEKAWKELAAKLHASIAKALAAQIEPDLKAGRYEAAVGTIQAAVAKGEVGHDDEQGALEQIRQLVAAPQQKKMEAAIGGPHPEAALAEIDGLVQLLKWELPKDLETTRHALAIWAECKKLDCKATPKPEPRFTYGKTEIHPSDASASAPIDAIASAEQVMVVARASSLSLVVAKDAQAGSTLKERLLAAAGWAPNDDLETTDTSDWLLPGDQLVGQRVFGPFSDKDKLYHLGVVASVDGANATVKRFSDDQLVTLPRASLRSGRVAPGTKVLTPCKSPLKIEPAKVEKEVPQSKGMPLFHLVCIADGKTAHDEVPGALATKPEWLPPRQP